MHRFRVPVLAVLTLASVSFPRTGSADEVRLVTLPPGTVLRVRLDTSVASDTSRREDPVHARLSRAIAIRGVTAIPEGSEIVGTVTEVKRPGRVKGRAHVALRFDKLLVGNEQYVIRTGAVRRLARTTKRKDALEIGGSAAGGAIIGGLLGGKKGAAVGGAVGGGAGTVYVLSTRGKDVRLGRGTPLSVKLLDPCKVRVRVAS